MSRRTRLWLVAGLALVLALVALSALAPDAPLFGFVVAVLWLWAAIGIAVLLWRSWRWLTYRVSVRLLLSYLLLGVTPFLICLALGGVILYMAMGQYTSVRFGTEVDALAALKMANGTLEEDMILDMNRDGKVDKTDAEIILEQAVSGGN